MRGGRGGAEGDGRMISAQYIFSWSIFGNFFFLLSHSFFLYLFDEQIIFFRLVQSLKLPFLQYLPLLSPAGLPPLADPGGFQGYHGTLLKGFIYNHQSENRLYRLVYTVEKFKKRNPLYKILRICHCPRDQLVGPYKVRYTCTLNK